MLLHDGRMTQTAVAHRIPAKSGNRDNDYWQAKCPQCPWVGGFHSNRTIEGRTLAERDASEHSHCSNR